MNDVETTWEGKYGYALIDAAHYKNCEQEIERLRSLIRKLREEQWYQVGYLYEYNGWGNGDEETEEERTQREKENKEGKVAWDEETEKLIDGSVTIPLSC